MKLPVCTFVQCILESELRQVVKEETGFSRLDDSQARAALQKFDHIKLEA